jgi:putative ABC transport system permease protein
MGLRGWLRAPGVALTAIVTLGLGSGATTAVFTVLYAALVRPLPYADAERLVVVRAEQDYEGASRPVPVSFQTDAIAAWPQASTTLSSVGFYAEGVRALSSQGGSELINTGVIEGPFFETVQGPLLMGRTIGPSDGATPVVVIGARVWQRSLGARPDVLGESITLNGEALTIVGVAAESFRGPLRQDDVWMTAAAARVDNPRCCSFTPIARLAPGVSVRAAAAEIEGITQALAARMPRALARTRVRVAPLRDEIYGRVTPALAVLSGAAGLLLALAVCNVAGLLLARHAAHVGELRVRRALGASTWRLARERLAESAWLGAAGGVVGVLVAWGSIRVIRLGAVGVLPDADTLVVDRAALTMAAGAALLVTHIVALGPMFISSNTSYLLARAGAGVTTVRGVRRVLGGITVIQQGMSAVLVVAAVLLGRSLVALMLTDGGFVSDHVATASVNLTMGRPLTSAQQAAVVERLVDRVARLPGVVAAGAGTSRPPDVSRMRLTLTRGADDAARATYQAAGVPVTPGYFAALGIPLQHGRLFTAADGADAPEVVILGASTARRLFGDRDPLGDRIELPILRDGQQVSRWMTVVGVVADVKLNGLDQPADDVVYRPFAQQAWVSAFLVVRTSGDADMLAAQLARAVAEEDPQVAVSDARSLDAVLASATALPRLRTIALGGLSVLALVFAAVGLAGVIAFTVAQRRQELGVRMALGADASRIVRMVLTESLGLTTIGLLLGLAGAFAVTRLLSGLLYGVSPNDPGSFGVAAAACLAASLVGSYGPARRAARTDLAVVLRAQ